MALKNGAQYERFASDDPYARISAAVLRAVFREAYAGHFSVHLWDGTQVPARGQSRFTLCVNHPGALRTAFAPPVDLNAGRAMAAGILDVEGDVEAAVDEMLRATSRPQNAASTWRLAMLLRRLPVAPLPQLREARLSGRRHSRERDRAAIGFHYDQPVEFYRTFLGRELVYSCAYFDEGVETLDDAQSAKIDYTLRKLRLQRGERLLDIGCGWGALVVRAAKLGAYVLGVTLSERQYEESLRRIEEEGLAERARVERWDYRELPATTFDKIVSVGMVEHVGRDNLPEYFRTAYALLKPGGLFLNHGIAQQGVSEDGKANGFMDRFIFPDGELVHVSEMLAFAERAGFEVRDVENLREHYARTLRKWIANLEEHRARAIAVAGAPTYKAWRLYLAGSTQGFRTGRLGLFQGLLGKAGQGGRGGVPLTRRDLYSPP